MANTANRWVIHCIRGTSINVSTLKLTYNNTHTHTNNCTRNRKMHTAFDGAARIDSRIGVNDTLSGKGSNWIIRKFIDKHNVSYIR